MAQSTNSSCCFDVFTCGIGNNWTYDIYLDNIPTINGATLEMLLNTTHKEMLYDVCREEFEGKIYLKYCEDGATKAVVHMQHHVEDEEEWEHQLKGRLQNRFERMFLLPARVITPTEQQVFQSQWKEWSFQERTEHLLEQQGIPIAVYQKIQDYCHDKGVSWRSRNPLL